MSRTHVAVLALACSAACGGPWDPVSFVDDGELCFESQSDQVALVVTADSCLSSTCTRDLEGHCSATIQGKRIEVSSEIHWEEHPGNIVHACSEDCLEATATCTIGTLEPGRYTVFLGEDEQPDELVVPVEGSCLF